MSIEHWWNDTNRKETDAGEENPIPWPVFPSQMPHEWPGRKQGLCVEIR